MRLLGRFPTQIKNKKVAKNGEKLDEKESLKGNSDRLNVGTIERVITMWLRIELIEWSLPTAEIGNTSPDSVTGWLD